MSDISEPAGAEHVNLPDWVAHPGLAWLSRASCNNLLVKPDGSVDDETIGRFFVAAGHVISPEQKAMCVQCPVRRECLIHAYLGNQGTMVSAGYFAGFSSGQRRNISFDELYAIVEDESARYRER